MVSSPLDTPTASSQWNPFLIESAVKGKTAKEVPLYQAAIEERFKQERL